MPYIACLHSLYQVSQHCFDCRTQPQFSRISFHVIGKHHLAVINSLIKALEHNRFLVSFVFSYNFSKALIATTKNSTGLRIRYANSFNGISTIDTSGTLICLYVICESNQIRNVKALQIDLCKPQAIDLRHFVDVNQPFKYWQVYSL